MKILTRSKNFKEDELQEPDYLDIFFNNLSINPEF